MALIPGVKVNVNEGATFNIGTADSQGHKIFVYDSAEWGGYCGTAEAKLVALDYAYDRASKRTEDSLVDAEILVNGTVDATYGYLYTTASGAKVYSSGSGKIITKAGTDTGTYQIDNQYEGEWNQQVVEYTDPIPITPAKLLNSNNTYTETDEATEVTTYTYLNGFWHQGEGHSVNETDGKCSVCGTQFFALVDGNTLCEDAAEFEATTATTSIHFYQDYNANGIFDLFGRTVTGATVTATIIDSKTDDYNAADAGSIANYAGPAVCSPDKGTAPYGKHYAAIKNTDGTYSFHRVGVSVTAYRLYLVGGQAYLGFEATFRGTGAGLKALTDLGFVIDNEPHMFTDGVHVAEDGTETSYNINEIKPTDESGYIDGMTVAVHYTGENSVGLTTTVQGKMLFDTSHALSTPRKIDLGANLKKVLDDSDVTEEDPYYTPIRNYLVANGVITEGGTEG